MVVHVHTADAITSNWSGYSSLTQHRHRQLLQLARAEGTLVLRDLHRHAILDQLALGLQALVLLAAQLREAKVLRGAETLTARELVLGAAERLEDAGLVLVARANRQKDLTDLHASDGAVGLTEGTTHAGLQTIGTSARKHLVDAQHVPRVHTDTQVELILARVLHHVLVAGHTRSLERLRRELLLLDRDEVAGEGELVDAKLLLASVVDADLRVGHATVEARLRVGLVLLVAVALERAATHGNLGRDARSAWL